jgi:hypothetical protein
MQHCYAVILLGVAALGCITQTGIPRAKGADEKGTVVEIDGLKSTTPSSWKEETPANKLRKKQFVIPRDEHDSENAQLLVIYLGMGQGGSAEDNVQRWKGLFTPPSGKSIDDVTKVEKLKVGAVPATYVDIHGTYKGASFEKLEPKPDYRMLAVYFGSPDGPGPYFFRLVGPARTVELHKKEFEDWMKGFK